MASNARGGPTPSPSLIGWVQKRPYLSHQPVTHDGPVTVESDIDLGATPYDSLSTLIQTLQVRDFDALRTVSEPSRGAGVSEFEPTETFRIAVRDHVADLGARDGWCADPTCGRTQITWPDDAAGPRCPCGAAIPDDGGAGDE